MFNELAQTCNLNNIKVLLIFTKAFIENPKSLIFLLPSKHGTIKQA